MGLIENIHEQTNNDTIFVYKTGSALFCNKCKDKDIVVVTSSGDDYRRLLRYEDYDIFCYSLDGLKKCASFVMGDTFSIYIIAFALAKGENVLYGTNPIQDFDYFAHKNKIIKALVENARKRDCNSRIRNIHNTAACLKQSIWLFANYFALINNSLDFTEEQLDIIQKCHDNELPRSYAEDVYQKLLAMLPQSERQVEQPTISYDELVDSKIREKYSASQEFAILRQRDTKPTEFAEYNAYCEQCKAEARAEIAKA